MPRNPEQARRGSRTRRALLALIDAFLGSREAASPLDRFRSRSLAGAGLLAILVAIPSLAAEAAAGDLLGMALIGSFAACIAVQLAALRLGAPIGALVWTMLGTVACFLVAVSLVTAEFQPAQLYWFLLLPLAAQVLAGPRGREADAPPSSRGPAMVLILAIGLGLAVVAAHGAGLNLGRSSRGPRWAQALDFALFMVSAWGLVFVHDLSAREAHAELAQLRRLLSQCAWCRKIRDRGDWVPLERYLAEHQQSDLTHGICPACLEKRYPGGE